jgi:gliding motility-associated-like protein
LNLDIRAITSSTIDTSICQGDSVIIGGQTFDSTGMYVITIPNSQSCDSFITLDLKVIPGSGGILNRSICNGDSITIAGQTFAVGGLYTIRLINSNGCDSIVTLNLSISNCSTDTFRILLPVRTSLELCNMPKPSAASVVTACDGSSTGTLAHGSWLVHDSCLEYIAGPLKGSDTLCLQACDTVPTCIHATYIVDVTGLPPLAVDDISSNTPNTPVVIHILQNDTTYDTDILTVCPADGIVEQPLHGSAVLNPDGTITYIPENGYAGTDSFRYQLCDPEGYDTATVFIQLLGCEIPNAISPNGDGKNDVFVISCAMINTIALDIFNRWGIEVFKSESYQNDWDATYNGGPLPDGTYYYVVKYRDLQNNMVEKAGFITVHR